MDIESLCHEVGRALTARGAMLACAESCTGGWIAKALTDIPGSSRYFDRGFVSYTNRAKQDMLGVSDATLAQYGAVSEATVREMADGALSHSQAQISVAVSGIAGPGGGTVDKPVGTVWFAWAVHGGAVRTRVVRFDGDRSEVRRQAVVVALEGVLDVLATQ